MFAVLAIVNIVLIVVTIMLVIRQIILKQVHNCFVLGPGVSRISRVLQFCLGKCLCCLVGYGYSEPQKVGTLI